VTRANCKVLALLYHVVSKLNTHTPNAHGYVTNVACGKQGATHCLEFN